MTYLREELPGEINRIHMMNKKDPYDYHLGLFSFSRKAVSWNLFHKINKNLKMMLTL